MPTYIERCDRPLHPERTHVHATRDGYPDTVLYGTPGVTEAHGYPRLRTAWGDERLFSKNPPPAQPCTIASHLGTPHTHTINGLWGSLDAGPGHLREAHPDGSWVVYSKTAPSHSVTRREVHLCEDPTHGGGPAHQMFPLDRIHTHSTLGWGDPAVPELARSLRVKDENGEDMLFYSDPLQVTVEFTEPAKPEHTVERCEYAHHPRERHVHTSLPDDGCFGHYWRIHGNSPIAGREDFLIDRHPDGVERVFSRVTDDIGTTFTPSPQHALPTTEPEPEPVVHTVERCAWLSVHPSAPHHHMRRAGENDRYHFWLAEGGRLPTSYAYEVEEWPDGSRKVFGGTRHVGQPVAAPVTEWEDGDPSE